MAAASPPLPNLAPLVGGIDRLQEEVTGLRTDMQALVQGLSLMLETQHAHSEMLRQLLEAATQEEPGENPMEALLRQVVTSLDRVTTTVQGFGRKLDRNSQMLAGAIVRGASQPMGGHEEDEEPAAGT